MMATCQKKWLCAALLFLALLTIIAAGATVYTLNDRTEKHPFADWSDDSIDFITPYHSRTDRLSDDATKEILAALRQVTILQKYRGEILDDGMGTASLKVVFQDGTHIQIFYTYARIAINGVWYLADRESCSKFARTCFTMIYATD